MRLRIIAAIVCAALALAVGVRVSVAGATLVYVKGGTAASEPEWVWAARDDGSAPRRLVKGSSPRVSPNGRLVLYESFNPSPRLAVVPTGGGRSRILPASLSTVGTFAWSPDSRTVVAVISQRPRIESLVLIDVASGTALRTISATAEISGVGFSPDGRDLLYTMSSRGGLNGEIYTVKVRGGSPLALTFGSNPVWGSRWIVFARWRKPPRADEQPKVDLYVIKPSRAGLHRLTRTHAPGLLSGLVPTAWSRSGKRLLAEFTGEDVSYAETVDPATGNVRRVGTFAQGLVGYGLSRDGTSILATATPGGWSFGPNPHTEVVAVPYRGGTLRVLARHAHDPDWNASHGTR